MIIGVVIALVAGGIGFASYYWLGADNPVEEECEKIIKDETGAVIDLSPGSSETTTKTPS